MRRALTGFLAAALLAVSAAARVPDDPPAPSRTTPTPAERPEPSVPLPPGLDRVLRDYESAWRARDAAALARLFAEDGYLLPAGKPPVKGRAAIQQHYTGSGGPLALRAFAFAVDGRVGFILGGFARLAGDPDSGTFTLTLRKDSDGRWLIVSDMDNTSRPPQPRP